MVASFEICSTLLQLPDSDGQQFHPGRARHQIERATVWQTTTAMGLRGNAASRCPIHSDRDGRTFRENCQIASRTLYPAVRPGNSGKWVLVPENIVALCLRF